MYCLLYVLRFEGQNAAVLTFGVHLFSPTHIRLRCPMCARTWELHRQEPSPPGETYTARCGNCGREGKFTTPPNPASRPVGPAGS